MGKSGGRPSKVKETRIQAYCAGIRRGLPKKEAALCAGVSYDTVNRWFNIGKDELATAVSDDRAVNPDLKKYCQFYKAVKRAEAKFEDELLRHVWRAAAIPKHWAAAMKLLERLRPQRYGPKLHLNGELDVNVTDPERIAQKLADLIMAESADGKAEGDS